MGKVAEAIVRNCLLHEGCEISENCGDIVIKFPSGVVRRSRRGAFGDLLIPMEDGREVKVSLGGLFAA